MTFRVELARQAEKALDRLDRITEKRLRDRLKEFVPVVMAPPALLQNSAVKPVWQESRQWRLILLAQASGL